MKYVIKIIQSEIDRLESAWESGTVSNYSLLILQCREAIKILSNQSVQPKERNPFEGIIAPTNRITKPVTDSNQQKCNFCETVEIITNNCCNVCGAFQTEKAIDNMYKIPDKIMKSRYSGHYGSQGDEGNTN